MLALVSFNLVLVSGSRRSSDGQVNGVSPNDGLRIAIPKATAGGGGMDVSLSYSTAKPGDAVRLDDPCQRPHTPAPGPYGVRIHAS